MRLKQLERLGRLVRGGLASGAARAGARAGALDYLGVGEASGRPAGRARPRRRRGRGQRSPAPLARARAPAAARVRGARHEHAQSGRVLVGSWHHEVRVQRVDRSGQLFDSPGDLLIRKYGQTHDLQGCLSDERTDEMKG